MGTEYNGSCSEGANCVCGGDTARVRAGCHNWQSAEDSSYDERPAGFPSREEERGRCSPYYYDN